MKIIDFIDDIKINFSEIAYLCTYHILNKIYEDVKIDMENKDKLLDIIQNYPEILKYLNDYAGTIYRQYGSSTNDIYEELCKYFDLDKDNIYTCKHIITKLQKQTPAVIMSLEDVDIKNQTINNFEEKLFKIKNSDYYLNHKDELEEDILILEKNISLVKRASSF